MRSKSDYLSSPNLKNFRQETKRGQISTFYMPTFNYLVQINFNEHSTHVPCSSCTYDNFLAISQIQESYEPSFRKCSEDHVLLPYFYDNNNYGCPIL